MIDLHRRALFHGPSPLSREPALVVELILGPLPEDKLRAALEVLRLECLDWHPHAQVGLEVTHAQQLGQCLAVWSHQALTFVRGFLPEATCVGTADPARAFIALPYHDPQLSWRVLQLGADWLNAIVRGEVTLTFPKTLEHLWQHCRRLHPDYQACIVMEAARHRGIPVAAGWGVSRHWRYGQGQRSCVMLESSSSGDGFLGGRVSQSKLQSKNALISLGLPTPAFEHVMEADQLPEAVAQVGFPCVIKPTDQGGGKGVSAGLENMDAVYRAFELARSFSPGPILLEAHVQGDDHRLMVVDGRFVAAIRRDPPSVVGDGVSTIEALVAAQNRSRDQRSLSHSGFKRPIRLDAGALAHLSAQGLSPDAVPAAGQVIQIRSNANLSTGGQCTDLTPQVHPEIRAMAEAIAQTLQIQMMGADYLSTDITRSPAQTAGQFIEINTTPGLDAMIAAGWSVRRAGELALGPQIGRIATRLLIVDDAHREPTQSLLRAHPWVAGQGWASLHQAGLSGMPLLAGPAKPWSGVQTLMGHRGLSTAVVLATVHDIQAHGLPLDLFDVAHVSGTLLPAWQGVVNACCRSVVRLDPLGLDAKALQALMQGGS